MHGSVKHYLLVCASVSFVLIELNPAWNVSSFRSAQITASLTFSAKQMSPACRARPGSAQWPYRKPAHINTQLRSCRHGRSRSIRMRMCRWGLLPCEAKPWPFMRFCLSACVCLGVSARVCSQIKTKLAHTVKIKVILAERELFKFIEYGPIVCALQWVYIE